MLQVEGLSKRFGRTFALKDADFTIHEGEVVGLLGENGAGKTTTLMLLSGALFPTSGRVRIGGRDLVSDFMGIKRKVGYLPERLPLDRSMRVVPYLDYVGRLKGLTRRERGAAVARVVADCGLDGVTGRGIGVLSRGLMMRVGLAQALIHNPELLLLDEPTAGLDPRQVVAMRRLILSLSGHHTILFSSHNLVEVSECCNRVILLSRGRVVAEDALADLEGRDGETRTLLVRFSHPPEDLSTRLAEMDGVVAVNPAPSGGAGAVVIHMQVGDGLQEQFLERVVFLGWGLREFRETSESLADIFVRRLEAVE